MQIVTKYFIVLDLGSHLISIQVDVPAVLSTLTNYCPHVFGHWPDTRETTNQRNK